MNKTGINYCDFTWNPTHGCSYISTGCSACWAKGMAKRLSAMGVKGYDPDDPFKVVCMPEKLHEPLKRKKPAVIAVSFMGDLYHPDIPNEFIDRVFGVMSLAPQHRFIILTKRAERMYNYHTGLRDDPEQVWRFEQQVKESPNRFHKTAMAFRRGESLSNVIGMVTVENQEAADERIPWLMKTPFAMRGISAEPLLGEIDPNGTDAGQILGPCDECGRFDSNPDCEVCQGIAALDLIVCGGESGHKARPMHPDWARRLRDDCIESNTSYFFKQWGAWIQCESSRDIFNHKTKCFETISAGLAFKRVGKKKAGHLLDGEEWHQMPEGMRL